MELNHTFAIMAYGESRYLENCIKSILEQTVESRVIITTSTPCSYISNLAARYCIDVFESGQNPGIASDWQFAASCVKTSYYTLAHQDDIYYPQYAETLIPLMENSLIAFCNYEETVGDAYVRSDTKQLKIKRMLLWPFMFTDRIGNKFVKKSMLRFGPPIGCPSVMYNKKMVGDFRYDASYKNNLDWDAWVRMSEMGGSFAYSRKILMSHRIHEESATSKNIEDSVRSEEDRKMFQRLWPGWIASVLSSLYLSSYKSNKIQTDK